MTDEAPEVLELEGEVVNFAISDDGERVALTFNRPAGRPVQIIYPSAQIEDLMEFLSALFDRLQTSIEPGDRRFFPAVEATTGLGSSGNLRYAFHTLKGGVYRFEFGPGLASAMSASLQSLLENPPEGSDAVN